LGGRKIRVASEDNINRSSKRKASLSSTKTSERRTVVVINKKGNEGNIPLVNRENIEKKNNNRIINR
jgi:hypothetical protein